MLEPPQAVFPSGILGVLQTPFLESGGIDFPSSERLVEDAIVSGADGFLVPAIASENAYLETAEKLLIAERVMGWVRGRVPVIWGAGSSDPEVCRTVGEAAKRAGGCGLLVAVPTPLYGTHEIVPFFASLSGRVPVPLMIQDWQPGGTGMDVATILRLREEVPTFGGLKIETLPAGPKYTAVLDATGGSLHVSGGWAVQQMIEALDRGVHAMIPECSMIRIYQVIDRLHRGGKREQALSLFNRLLPVLCFTNQDLDTSIRFFKRLLVRKGIFTSAVTRLKSGGFDDYSERIAEELIERVLEIEASL